MAAFKRVLIVDDDADDVESFESIAKEVSPNMQITSARNGVELFKVLKTKPTPDLIVLDLNMPLMNGYQCLKQIRKNEKFFPVKIMVYTTSSNKADIDYCMKNGADYYVVKPGTTAGVRTLLKELSQGVVKDRTTIWD